jgi:phosphatidate cytidylyltransferase
MTDLKKRLLVSTLSIATIILLVFFSTHPQLRWILAFSVAALATTGVWEYARLMRHSGLNPSTALMCSFAFLFVILSFASLVNKWGLSPLLLVVLAAGLAFFLVHFRQPINALREISAEFFSLFYIAIPLSLMLFLLLSPHLNKGRWWFFYLIAVTKMVDIGGYFVGKFLGSRKLASTISPGKTIEGTIGGFLSALIVSWLFSLFGLLSLTASLCLGALIAILSQLGDLAESLLKREAGVKDSNTLPGLGGVLDMIDSLLFTTPTLSLYLFYDYYH